MEKNLKPKNFLITGIPGCGKTTLILNLIKKVPFSAGGFFTKEIREKGKRVGFEISDLEGKKKILAHIDFKDSKYKVSKYGVDISALEKIGVEAIKKALAEKDLIVIDEIGKMELFSKEFKKIVIEAFDSKKKVLATIKLKGDGFCQKLKGRKDTLLFLLKKGKQKEIEKEILKYLLSS